MKAVSSLAPLLRRRHQRINRVLKIIGLTVLVALLAAGCGDDGDDADSGSTTTAKTDDALVVYSGREEELVRPLYEAFEEETGIKLEVRFGESAELAALIAEEGDDSPADVFYAQDAGAIGAIEDQLAPLSDDLLETTDERFQDADGRWMGVTGRVRTLIYNTDAFADDSELPESVYDLTGEQWKGKVGVAPTNASFIGFVSAMRLADGDEKTMEFLTGLAENDAQIYPKNGAIVEATAAEEVEVGLVNHYYLYEQLAEDPEAPIDNHFFESGDPGAMINVSAMGILDSTDNEENAERLVEFMLDEGQRFIVEEAEEREYPLVPDAVGDSENYKELPPLDDIQGPDIELSKLGEMLSETVEMIRESGLGE